MVREFGDERWKNKANERFSVSKPAKSSATKRSTSRNEKKLKLQFNSCENAEKTKVAIRVGDFKDKIGGKLLQTLQGRTF